MKMTILQMQALEYCLYYKRPEFKPVYRSQSNEVFTGHFFDLKSDDAQYWIKDRFGDLHPRSLSNFRPHLFDGWFEDFDMQQIKFQPPVVAFAYVGHLLKIFPNQYHNPEMMDYDNTSPFEAEPFIFDYKSGSTELPFLLLDQEEDYDLISLEENSGDNA
ncbi:hypothetical protein [Furfurilactobacillus milii]|uniref:Uncharacterized protein n=1 Tax=Furfurilactobacillus milii TaxID=2888272 RepID=A0ABT6DCG8_9LACO|nr:hypothetical protein [Furfurilactobacillus milii]QLE66961.1 hypothetical protein LROSL2_1611 [Furfurilactobacillus rossiae]MCF6161971.1 hypothetical protein [Furfurilactobacillus milii]MCF6164351.1 hypothetical protein [Furfurilactobacillus milii]MDF9914839.1 hypothetical protein [Furfurilactobacillus milii]QLE69391.1 hypothetical protein LROSL3_1612 [Furfurilactobacillus rossiae]